MYRTCRMAFINLLAAVFACVSFASDRADLRVGVASADRGLDVTCTGSVAWSDIQDVVVVDGLAYCTAEYGRLILNVADSSAPTWVSQLYLRGRDPERLTLVDSLAYLVASFQTAARAYGGQALGNDIYVADLHAFLVLHATPTVSVGSDAHGQPDEFTLAGCVLLPPDRGRPSRNLQDATSEVAYTTGEPTRGGSHGEEGKTEGWQRGRHPRNDGERPGTIAGIL
jgi:hypothetical protein